MIPTDRLEAAKALLDDYGRLMRVLHGGRGGRAAPWVDLDLTIPQLKLLGLLSCRPGGIHGRELATLLGVGPSAVTALVDRLVEPGYVRREEDPHDRRITWIRLTERGQSIIDRMTSGQRERLAELLGQLSPDELAEVARAFQLLRVAAERWSASRAV
jgi:DNA-binding MarR family transcriptional regulator